MERFDFVNRANAEYIDRLYEQYQRDPRSLDPTWQAYFSGFEYAAGKHLKPTGTPATASASPAAGSERLEPHGDASLGIFDLVHAYRELGHFVADLDPLGHNRASHPLLELGEFNLTPA